MEIVLASNFDDALVESVRELPVTTFFGNFPVGLTGGGRPPQILPQVSPTRFREHVAAVHRAGREFYATLNSSDLGLIEYRAGFLPQFLNEVAGLLDLGIDGFVVALPVLLEAIRMEYPNVPVSVSTFARIRSVTQAEYFQRLGADTVIIEEANRDFALVRGLVRLGLRVEVLVNQTCIPSCPYRCHHLNTSSLASQTGRVSPRFEYPIVECGLEVVRDPAKLISSILVRPEDLEVYEEAGVHRFKISGRNRSTDWLVRAARAYSARHYNGDLLDILSYVQVRGTMHALKRIENAGAEAGQLEAFREAFAPLSEVSVRNNAFPKGFLRRIAATDCEHISCAECGYCGSVAQRVLTIGGKPLSEYRPPSTLSPAVRLLPHLGPDETGATTEEGYRAPRADRPVGGVWCDPPGE